MSFSEKSLTIKCDFTKRFCENIVREFRTLQSNIYFITLDKKVSAQSLVGLLDSKIKNGDIIRINAFNTDKMQAEKDLQFVVSVILGD